MARYLNYQNENNTIKFNFIQEQGKKEYELILGNYTTAGWYWQDKGSLFEVDWWFFFGTMSCYADEVEDLFGWFSKNKVGFRDIKQGIIEQLKNEKFYALYPYLGHNKFWYFGEDQNTMEIIAGYFELDVERNYEQIEDIYSKIIDKNNFESFSQWLNEKYDYWLKDILNRLEKIKSFQKLASFFISLYGEFYDYLEYIELYEYYITDLLEKIEIKGV